MTKMLEVYKCDICGNIVEMLHTGQGELVCCGEAMKLKEAHEQKDEGKEKHVPVVEKTDSGIKVKVGSNPHPMKDEHYIEWVELVVNDGERTCKKFLKPGEEPETEFPNPPGDYYVREYCNVHGLWRN